MNARALLAGIALVCAAPTLAQAQDTPDTAAEAKHQFDAGKKAFESGRFKEAAMAFEAAASYKPNAVALYTAGVSWEQASQPERAADAYGRAVNLQGLTAQQSSTAKSRLASLEKTMGALTVTGPDGDKVQLDTLTEAPVPAHLHGTPGMHTLHVKTPDGTITNQNVSLEVGATKTVDVTPKAAPDHTTETPPTPKPEKKVVVETPVARTNIVKSLGFAAIGVGGASALAGLVLGLSANDAGDAYNAGPTRQAYDHANALAMWTTVSFIVAGVFVAGGVTLVLLPSKEAKPKPTPDENETQPVADKGSDASARLLVAPTAGGLVLRGAF